MSTAKKILLVEDEAIDAMDIKCTLRSFGYDVPYIASSGEEAIEKALEIRPDLIIIDIILKGNISGIEVASKIKHLNIPFIYLTANSEASIIEDARLTEPYGYIIKPYDRREFEYAIKLAIYKNSMENDLKESEEKYRRIVENLFDAYLRGDKDCLISMASPSAARMFKFDSPEDMVGIPAISLYKSSLDRENMLNELKKQGKVQNMEFKGLRNDGTFFWASMNSQFYYDNDGEIMGTESFIRDITEKKKAEETLKLSQIQLENAMDLADLANWELDLTNKVFIFNDKFYSMIGTSIKEEGSYKMSFKDFINKYVHPEDAAFIVEGLEKSIKSKKSHFGPVIEHRIVRADGEIQYLVINMDVVPLTKNQSSHIYGSVQDISNRKMIEEKLQETIEEKEMLLKEIHHRVKNNLMIISSLLNLQSRYIKDQDSKDIFKESQHRAESMAIIHEKLYQSNNFKRINFKDYIDSLSKSLLNTYVTDSNNIKLEIDAAPIFLNINTAIPLGLTVNELITNSLKHAFPDGNSGTINLNIHQKDDHYELIIKDDGIGFPVDLDYENSESLGLMIVNSLVNQIDANISLLNDNGAEFKICFNEQQ